MTTVPPVEDYIHRRATMESQLANQQEGQTTIPARSLSQTEDSILRNALQIAIDTKRRELNTLLNGYAEWSQINIRSLRDGQPENAAEGYLRDLKALISGIDALKVMHDNAKKNRVVVREDA